MHIDFILLFPTTIFVVGILFLIVMVTLILLVLLFILKKRKKKTMSVDFKYAEVSEVNLWNIKFVQNIMYY